MTLFVVRHAHAGERSAWEGDDTQRPLTGRGRTQSEGIADAIGGHAIKRIVSSPAVRCVQTVQPLADRLGLMVEIDDRVFEGTSSSTAADVIADLAGTEAVVCSHGDVIPMMLDVLVAAGMQPERDLVWQKASIWAVDRVDGRWTRGRYLLPPG